MAYQQRKLPDDHPIKAFLVIGNSLPDRVAKKFELTTNNPGSHYRVFEHPNDRTQFVILFCRNKEQLKWLGYEDALAFVGTRELRSDFNGKAANSSGIIRLPDLAAAKAAAAAATSASATPPEHPSPSPQAA